jgi:hypothetical protein
MKTTVINEIEQFRNDFDMTIPANVKEWKKMSGIGGTTININFFIFPTTLITFNCDDSRTVIFKIQQHPEVIEIK